MELNIKPVIGMCHLNALPNDYNYDKSAGIEGITNKAIREITALQEGGIDAIIFSNEFSFPYDSVPSITNIAAFTAVICNIKKYLSVPFGIDYMYNPIVSVDIANAVNANFVRGILTSSYFDGINNHTINTIEFNHHLKMYSKELDVWCSVYPEQIAEAEQKGISLELLIDRIKTQISPRVICLHSGTILKQSNTIDFSKLDIPIYADGGCTQANINSLSKRISGVIVGTYIKENHNFFNEISLKEVKHFVSHFNR